MERIEQKGFPGVFLSIPSRTEWLKGTRTVGELRAFLRDFPKDTPVTFRDFEGNENALTSITRTGDTLELA